MDEDLYKASLKLVDVPGVDGVPKEERAPSLEVESIPNTPTKISMR